MWDCGGVDVANDATRVKYATGKKIAITDLGLRTDGKGGKKGDGSDSSSKEGGSSGTSRAENKKRRGGLNSKSGKGKSNRNKTKDGRKFNRYINTFSST